MDHLWANLVEMGRLWSISRKLAHKWHTLLVLVFFLFYSSCSSLLLVLLFFLFYSSCSNFLIFHFADFIHLTKACIDGVLLIPFSVSFVSLNYACIVGWNCCNIYGWMPLCWTCYVWWNYACNIYGWMMKLCVGYLICLLCNGLLKYIYICHIYLWWKLLDLIKNR